jgi:cytochrome c553
MRTLVALAAVGLLTVAAPAYGQSPAQASAADLAFFEAKVRPLLVENCYRCHSASAKKIKGGLRLDSRAAILKGGDSGPAVVPGQPQKSRLIWAIHQRDESLQMPPTGKLPASAIAILEEWVRRGAPFPGASTVVPVQETINLAEGRKFWSFQTPKTSEPPPARDRAWSKRRIDAFILSELDKRGLDPSPQASPRVMIRRAYFDLIGLPPTPEEVDCFLRESEAQPQAAYEKLIDRLLASPHYGERWARLWLDLARYCDVAEPWSESKAKPYLYRDWVVRALNADVPYDRFVQLQLAADLMPDARSEDRAALGFLGLSPVYWKELKLDPEVIKMVVAEEWEERIGAVTSTFLGLTVACARCHDHKFDPITTHDYYALAGIFASTKLADRPVQTADLFAGLRVPALSPTTSITAVVQAGIDHQKPSVILAPVVEEASLHVLPDGPHKTKLVYKPGEVQNLAVQIRGNPSNPGPFVSRRFLAVLSPDDPRPFRQGSGRLELAQAIVGDGAPLAARVIVNRVWKHHFGAGLVETPSDFGAQGERPSHPALLDDLTARFIAHGWSLKWLHKEIMLSATYRQASSHNERKTRVDPTNRLLWRMNPRRLEVEAWRDAMLAVTGTLDRTIGGPPLELGDANNKRRTLYGTVKRRELHDLLRLHDFPDPTAHSPTRLPTTTPLQQLYTLNSPFMQQQAAALVRRLKAEVPDSDEARVRRVYLLLFGREAKETQLRLGIEFLRGGGTLDQYAQILLGSNEFLFVD